MVFLSSCQWWDTSQLDAGGLSRVCASSTTLTGTSAQPHDGCLELPRRMVPALRGTASPLQVGGDDEAELEEGVGVGVEVEVEVEDEVQEVTSNAARESVLVNLKIMGRINFIVCSLSAYAASGSPACRRRSPPSACQVCV